MYSFVTSLLGYNASDYVQELDTVKRQRRFRHLVHQRVNLSRVKLKPTTTVVKCGYWDVLRKNASVPIPNDSFSVEKVQFVDEYDNRCRKKRKRHK